MISLDEALAHYQAINALATESIPLQKALWRQLAEPVAAPYDLPLGDQSAMDGYALCSADTHQASTQDPVPLPIVGEIAAGLAPSQSLPRGHATRIFTGAWLPAGADAMLPQERVKIVEQQLLINQPVPAFKNIRRKGEELRSGTPLVDRGALLQPGHIATLAMAGIAEVQVQAEPRIGVLITGKELRAAGSTIAAGQAFDANGPALAALLEAWQMPAVTIEHVGDSLDATVAALESLSNHSDLIVTTGGVSVGAHDYVREAAQNCGFREVFWRVAQKPGKPMLLAQRGRQWLLGLPGNPAAVYLCAQVHLRQIISRLNKGRLPELVWKTGCLSGELNPDLRREMLLRVRKCKNSSSLQPLDKQLSHMLSNLPMADGIARIPASGSVLRPDTKVNWLEFATSLSFIGNN